MKTTNRQNAKKAANNPVETIQITAERIVQWSEQFPGDDLRNSISNGDLIQLAKFYVEYGRILPSYNTFVEAVDKYHESL
jgi:hypothetical protein